MLLALDSSRQSISFSLYDETQASYIFEKCFEEKSSQMISLIKNSFDEFEVKPNLISKILCTIGPGSFTGIRTGLTLAKTLASQLDLKIFPVNNFDLLRFELADPERPLCINAGKNDYYISLDNQYENQESNFFSFEKKDMELVNFTTKNISKLMIEYFLNLKHPELKSFDDVEAYYLREPSIGKKATTTI